MLLALALCLAQEAPSHAALHPASAELFIESPDVPALLAAYHEAPMARFFADPESLGALRKVLGRPELTGGVLLNAGLGMLPLPPEVSSNALASLEELAAASLSLAGPSAPGGPGVLIVLDWRSEEAAAKANTALSSFASNTLHGWISVNGVRVEIGGGSITNEAWTALRDGKAPCLDADPAWKADAARLGPAKGALVARGFHRRSPLELAREAVAALSRLPLGKIGELFFGGGMLHWRMSLASGRFVSESFAPGAARPLADAPWLAPAPLAPALLEEVHPACMVVAGASFDPAGLRDALSQGSGADLAAAPLFDKLGRNLVLFLQPMRGPGMPRTFCVVELEETEGAFEDLTSLAQALSASTPGVEVKESKYKDVPILTVRLPEGVLDFGDFGKITPVMAVLDGRLIITSGSLTLKEEIRRRQGDPEEALGPAAYPWTGGRRAFPAEASAVVFVDWAAQVEALFGLARTFGPMLEGAVGDLPFDFTDLPSPLLFTRHMPPTVHTVRQVEGGLAVRHEAGFAFETWIGLPGLFALVRRSLDGPPIAVKAEAAPAAADPATDTRRAMLELRTALVVYKLDRGAFPDALARLLEPSAAYPAGYLDGRTALPLDAWGRAYRYALAPDGAGYRVWSVGPDGVDQDGAGDDVGDL